MRYADFVANVGSGAGTTMRFITKNSSNAYSTTVIDNNGNVGIGTSSPDSKLQVEYTTTSNGSAAIAEFGTSGSGAIANSGHQVIIGGPNVSGYTGAMIYSDSTSGVGIISFADGRGANDSWRGMIQYEHSNDAMTFSTNTSERMRINSSGGIKVGPNGGDTAHTFEIDTSGNANHGLFVNADEARGAGDYALYVDDEDPNARGTVRIDSATGTAVDINCASGYLALDVSTPLDNVAKFTSTDASAAIVIQDSNSTDNYNRLQVVTNDMLFVTNNSEALRIDSQRNLKFADNGTNPSAVANTAFMFNDGGELKVLDELGNTTTISPHNFELIPDGASEDMAFAYHSTRHTPEGKLKKVNVDMMKLARLVEELTGEKLVYIDEQ